MVESVKPQVTPQFSDLDGDGQVSVGDQIKDSGKSYRVTDDGKGGLVLATDDEPGPVTPSSVSEESDDTVFFEEQAATANNGKVDVGERIFIKNCVYRAVSTSGDKMKFEKICVVNDKPGRRTIVSANKELLEAFLNGQSEPKTAQASEDPSASIQASTSTGATGDPAVTQSGEPEQNDYILDVNGDLFLNRNDVIYYRDDVYIVVGMSGDYISLKKVRENNRVLEKPKIIVRSKEDLVPFLPLGMRIK